MINKIETMKKLTLLFLPLLFLGFGCTSAEPSEQMITTVTELPTQDTVDEITLTEPTEEITEPTEPAIYVQFVINVHDWVFPEQSIQTLNHLIDLHEEHQVPVEFHLTDTVTQNYVAMAPELMERLRTSEYVAVSYHVRPPHPMYNGFDSVGLMDMKPQKRYETLLGFETHKLDMAAGRYIDEPGGYQFLKDQLGYAPRIVGGTSGKGGKEFSRVFEEMGALFTVLHEGGSNIEDTLYGLNKRPENIEVKFYEFKVPERFDPEAEFADWTAGFDGTKDWFVNLKYHENNFYLSNTPFAPIYWEDWDGDRKNPLRPPYDTSASIGLVETRSPTMQQGHWDLYTKGLDYVSKNSDWLNPINSVDLESMLETIE